MQGLIKFILISGALFGIGWFVSFQYDPYRVCVDHPDRELKKDFFLCEPGGFTLQKGTRLERPADDRFPWEKNGDVIIGTENPRKRYKNRQEELKANMDAFNCKDEFYQLSDSDFLKMSQKELDALCTPKNQKRNAPKEAPSSMEELPNTGVKDL